MQEKIKFKYHPIINKGIWEGNIPELETTKIIDTIYQLKSKYNSSSNNSNEGGWQSEPNLHHSPSFLYLTKIINKYIHDLFPTHSNPGIKAMWVNITSFLNYNRVHTHSNSIGKLSGVIYLKTPKNSGRIVFQNPLLISLPTYFTPKEKDILLFDSFIPHSVEPNLSQEDRISIAFNY